MVAEFPIDLHEIASWPMDQFERHVRFTWRAEKNGARAKFFYLSDDQTLFSLVIVHDNVVVAGYAAPASKEAKFPGAGCSFKARLGELTPGVEFPTTETAKTPADSTAVAYLSFMHKLNILVARASSTIRAVRALEGTPYEIIIPANKDPDYTYMINHHSSPPNLKSQIRSAKDENTPIGPKDIADAWTNYANCFSPIAISEMYRKAAQKSAQNGNDAKSDLGRAPSLNVYLPQSDFRSPSQAPKDGDVCAAMILAEHAPMIIDASTSPHKPLSLPKIRKDPNGQEYYEVPAYMIFGAPEGVQEKPADTTIFMGPEIYVGAQKKSRLPVSLVQVHGFKSNRVVTRPAFARRDPPGPPPQGDAPEAHDAGAAHYPAE